MPNAKSADPFGYAPFEIAAAKCCGRSGDDLSGLEKRDGGHRHEQGESGEKAEGLGHVSVSVGLVSISALEMQAAPVWMPAREKNFGARKKPGGKRRRAQ